MLKYFKSIIILLLCLLSMAMTWNKGNPITVAWNAVTPINSGDSIKYQIYIRVDPSGNFIALGSPLAATQATIQFSNVGGGYFDIGIAAVEYSGTTVVGISTISWSNDPVAVQNGNTFGEQIVPSTVGGANVH